MKVSVKSRVHRTLRNMSSFSSADDSLGRYLNEGGDPPSIKILESGLLLERKASSDFVDFSKIYEARHVGSKTDTRLEIKMKDGSCIALEILGGNGRALDIFEWVRFLQRVVEDNRDSPL